MLLLLQAYENHNHTAPENEYGEDWYVFHFLPESTDWVHITFPNNCQGPLSVMELQLFFYVRGKYEACVIDSRDRILLQ